MVFIFLQISVSAFFVFKREHSVVQHNSIETKINGTIFDKKISIRKRNDGGYTLAHGSTFDHAITPSTLYYSPKYIRALINEFGVLKLSIGGFY